MKRRLPAWLGALGPCALGLIGCNVGSGEGQVQSDLISVQDCAVRAFDLAPHFFAAIPSGDNLEIRIQRQDVPTESGDGLAIVVRGLSTVTGELGQSLEVGMPLGVRPPGVPVVADSSPAPVNMSLYLNDSCDVQNAALYSVSGSIVFSALFDGDTTELSAADRLIEASFDVQFADPRSLTPGQALEDGQKSRVTGSFRFYFERGKPAQPFP